MSENQNRVWAAYVRAVIGDDQKRQREAAAMVSEKYGAEIAQATISRWLDPKYASVPEPARVAAFALAFEHSPLEAFVAAGLLDMQYAQPGLDDESVAFIIRLERDITRLTRQAGRAGRKPQPRPRRR